MKKVIFSLLAIFLLHYANSQSIIKGVVNEYYAIQEISLTNSYAIVSPSPSVNLVRGAKALLYQAQGASIDVTNSAAFGTVTNYGNAGKYELTDICKVNNDTVFFLQSLLNNYDTAGRVQLVYVPNYTNAIIIDTLTSTNWNGNTGGIIAINITKKLIVNGLIDANGKGFRGGLHSNSTYNCSWVTPNSNYFYAISTGLSGRKGEGIYNPQGIYESGRGAAANGGGGGNDHNAGGGGGANLSAGGLGGANNDPGSFTCRGIYPGALGRNLNTSPNRIFFGGGGGAGHTNNNSLCSGGNGGGLIFIFTDTIEGAGKIQNNGVTGKGAIGDGGGGGGAGGSTILNSKVFNGSINLESIGGNGGYVNNGNDNRCMGPGGGGSGGGVFYATSNQPTSIASNLTGGVPGTVFNSIATGCNGTSNGATSGGVGIQNFNFIPQKSFLINNNCCSALSVSLGRDTSACIPDTILLTSNTNNATSFLWSTNDTTPTIRVFNSSQYILRVSDGYCSKSDTINVNIYPKTNFSFSGNVTACTNSYTLNSPITGVPLLWSTGDTTSSISVTNSGTYWLRAGNIPCTKTDSVRVTLTTPFSFTLGNDVTKCAGDTVFLASSMVPANSTYLWSTGSTNNSINATTSGTYWCRVTSGLCSSIDSIDVLLKVLPNLNLGTDTSICIGETIILSSPNSALLNIWNNTTISSLLAVNQTGTYILKMTDAPCTISDTINIEVLDPSFTLGPDLVICQKDEVILKANKLFDAYLWSTNSTDTTIKVNQNGSFYLTGNLGRCGFSDSINIAFLRYPEISKTENIFTPNDDKVNDFWEPELSSLIKVQIEIRDRWGRLIIKSNDPSFKWDGKIGNIKVDEGTYFYTIQFESPCLDSPKIIQGFIRVLY